MEKLLQFFNTNAGAFNVLFSLVVAAATVFYAVLTRRLVNETERMRLAQTEPSISVRVEPSEVGFNFMLLVIENVGAGPAYDVTFHASPDFTLDHVGPISKTGLFQHGLPYLAPRQRISSFLANLIGQADEIAKVGGKMEFAVEVTYRGALSATRTERYQIDFRHLLGITTIGKPPLQSIAHDLEKIEKSLNHLATGFKRMKVDTYSASDRAEEERKTREWMATEREKRSLAAQRPASDSGEPILGFVVVDPKLDQPSSSPDSTEEA